MSVTSTDPARAASAGLSRRRFLADAGSAALAFSVVKPELVRAGGAASNGESRASSAAAGAAAWIADLFQKHGGYNIVALADYFPDRVDALARSSGCRRRAASPDCQPIAGCSSRSSTPSPSKARRSSTRRRRPTRWPPGSTCTWPSRWPWTCPAARRSSESAAKATAQQAVLPRGLPDEGQRAVHRGPAPRARRRDRALRLRRGHVSRRGPVRGAGRACPLGRPRRAACAAWGLSREFSGDIITEQNIHTLDVMSWIMGQPPVSAYGTGGRKFREVGTCWDTFSIMFKYADDVGIAFSSRQFDGFRARGRRASGTACSAPRACSRPSTAARCCSAASSSTAADKTDDIYEQGAVNNIAAFHDSDRAGRLRQPDRRRERAQQPRDDPRANRRLRGPRRHVGRDPAEQRAARPRSEGAEDMTDEAPG